MKCSEHDACIDAALLHAKEICLTQGWRLTPIRQRVLELVWQSHKAVKAYDLLDVLQSEQASAKPPTVYRALDFLLEAGLIHKVNSLNAFVGCSHPTKKHRCMFLICQECGQVDECCDEDLSKSLQKVADKANYHLTNIAVELTGRCASCH